MKFSCKTSDLLSALQLVSRAIGSDQTLPILQNILLVTEDQNCTISATNLELSIVTVFAVESESNGSITIPAKAILNFVQYNQDEKILLEMSEGSQLKCTSKHAKALIAGEAASAYPVITTIESNTKFLLPIEPLKNALSLVTFTCAKTTARPVISGVFLNIHQETITFVGTDSYRLSEYSIVVPGMNHDISCIIPAKFLEELKGVMSLKNDADKGKEKKEQFVEILISDQQVESRVGNIRLTSRLIDGKFPDYVQVLPKTKTTTVRISTKNLLSAVKRMHYFAKEVNNNITFSIQDNTLRLLTKQTQIGRDESDLQVSVEGENNKIALSSHYIIDFLSRITEDEVIMEILDKLHPAVFTLPDNHKFLHLIMPLRMTDE